MITCLLEKGYKCYEHTRDQGTLGSIATQL
jgi:hypothetical protein